MTTDRQAGDRFKLTDFVREYGKILRHKYGKLTAREKKAYARNMVAVREEKKSCVRASPRALQLHVNATFSTMSEEVSLTRGICFDFLTNIYLESSGQDYVDARV